MNACVSEGPNQGLDGRMSKMKTCQQLSLSTIAEVDQMWISESDVDQRLICK